MGKRKRKVTLPPVTAGGRDLVVETVEGGYESGGVERCQRRVATIDTMRRKRQITERQYDAANRLREASSTMGLRSVDWSRDMVDEGQGEGPVFATTLAARDLATSKAFMGPELADMVMAIAVDGRSIEEVAAERFGVGNDGRAGREHRRMVSEFLHVTLDSLADLWWPKRHDGIQGTMDEGARPTIGIMDAAENLGN